MLWKKLDQNTLNLCVADFRKCLALYIIYYYCHFLTRFSYIFGSHGMVDREYVGPVFAPSLLFISNGPWLPYVLFGVLVFLSVLFFLGKLNRGTACLLFLLNLSFQNANPYILHEPQQITSLFLLLFTIFLPLKNEDVDPFVFRTLVFSLGVYYFFAGMKKAIDPKWLSGDALSYILHWNMIGVDNVITKGLLRFPWLAQILNFFTLAFEMTFFLALFSRWFFVYLVMGVVFHVFIKLTCAVGTFSEVMLVWYALVFRLAWHAQWLQPIGQPQTPGTGASGMLVSSGQSE